MSADTEVQVGLPPNRIDILTSISDVPDFARAWEDRVVTTVRGHDVPFLGRQSEALERRP